MRPLVYWARCVCSHAYEILNYNGTPSETTLYTRDGNSHFVTDKFDALNRDTHYTYDFSTTNVGNLLSVTRLYNTSNAFTTSFTYTPAFNQLETITDPLNYETQFLPFSPDTNGSIQKYIDPVNNTITFTYNTAGQILTATDQANDQTVFGYATGTGDLTSVQDPNGNSAKAGYDAAGRLTSVTDPLPESIELSTSLNFAETLYLRPESNYRPSVGSIIKTFIRDPRHAVFLQDMIAPIKDEWLKNYQWRNRAFYYKDEVYWQLVGTEISDQEVEDVLEQGGCSPSQLSFMNGARKTLSPFWMTPILMR